MAIEVMLMDNVKKLGKAGEIVKVALCMNRAVW